MRTRSLSLALGTLLLTGLGSGLAIAQAPDQNQSQVGIAPQSAQSEQQTGQQPGQTAPQAEARHAVDPARAAKHLGKQLGLTQDQVAQIQPIIAERQQQVESIRADQSLMPRDRRMKMRSVMMDSRNKIEALLTDPQKQQFDEMLASRRGQREKPQAQ
jgi:Spy/CpxP family protein refolding chaperone